VVEVFFGEAATVVVACAKEKELFDLDLPFSRNEK